MNKIKLILEEVLERKIEKEITNSTLLREDLGLDSLKLAQLTVLIEDEFGVDIFDTGNVETIGEILTKIKDYDSNS
jgi:acyl carrier protein